MRPGRSLWASALAPGGSAGGAGWHLAAALADAAWLPLIFALTSVAEWLAAYRTCFGHHFKYVVAAKPKGE